MEGLDLISDSYSAELIALMIVERIWSKVRAYLDERSIKEQELSLQDRLAELEQKIEINTALDKERHGKG